MTAVVPAKPRDIILAEMAEKYTDELNALAPKGADAAHYIASLRLYFAQNQKVLQCTSLSIFTGMLRLAQTGLELGVSADLLPFENHKTGVWTCQFSPRYNGIIELALGAGSRSVNADVVREGDFFEFSKGIGADFYLRHQKKSSGKPITHGYAIAELKPGSYAFEVLFRDEIEAHRQRYSQQWKKGTLEDIPWYAKKTAVKRLSPYLPKNARFAAALQFAEEIEPTPPREAETIVEGKGVNVETGEIIGGGERTPEDEELDRKLAAQ